MTPYYILHLYVTMTISVRSPYGLKFQPKSILKICLPVKTKLNQKPVMCVHLYAVKKKNESCSISHFPYCTYWASYFCVVLFRCIKCYRSVCLQLILVMVQHLLDHLGEGYDQAVLEYQDQLAGICLICYPINSYSLHFIH